MKYLVHTTFALLLIPITIASSTAVAQDDAEGLPPKTLEVKKATTQKTTAQKATAQKTSTKRASKGQALGLQDLKDSSATTSNNTFTSTFSTFHKRNGLKQSVTVESDALTYYSGTHRVSRLKDIQLVSKSTRKKLGIQATSSALPVSLINDGTTQVMVWRQVQNKQRDTLYKLTVYRVFGRYFGKLTDQTIAVKLAGKSTILPTRTIEWVQGKTHVDMRVKLLDRSGQPVANGTRVYRYNEWEGMYRTPQFVPTSPTNARTAHNAHSLQR